MKKRLTAYMLAVAMLCSVIPAAAAYESVEQEDTAVSATDNLYAELPMGCGSLTRAGNSAAFEPQILAQEQHEQMVAAADFEEYVYSKNYQEEVENSTEAASLSSQTPASGFSNYGAQLSGLQYQFDESRVYKKKIAVGAAMKKLYDNVRADLGQGTRGVVFRGDDVEGIQRLGVTVTIPTAKEMGFGTSSDEQDAYEDTIAGMAIDLGWVVYRSLDMDCPEMFYSNGYCSLGYQVKGDRLTFYIVPMYRKGFETIQQRTSLKEQLDAKTAEIVKGAEQYSRAYDKIKYFDAWLCQNNTYNDAAVASEDYSATVSGAPWSSVSALLSSSDSSIKEPVCEGYSRAFQLLCSKAGIQATVVVSDSGEHMWNNLRYGNYWTGMDVTWNDSGSTKEYFCSTVNNTSGHMLDDADFLGWMVYPSLQAIPDASVLPYYDVPAAFWGRPYIQDAYNEGYMSGTSCVMFSPNTKITRGQFAQMLYSISGKPAVTYEARFTDVPQGKWYTNAVIWAAQSGLVSGYPDGTFGVNNPISRQDITVILYSRAGKPEIEPVDLEAMFTDADQISDYAEQSINWAVSSNILSGNGNGTLNPRGKTTRTEAAVIFSKIA